MRIASIVLNTALLLIAIGLLVDNGWPSKLVDQLMVCVFFITPIVTLITLWGLKAGNSESWLSLFLQRKKLEEKSKLEKLKNSAE